MDLIDSGNDRVILAGDFNLWSSDALPIVENNIGLIGLIDLIDLMGSVDGLPKLVGGVGGSRIWTHKNGNSPNTAEQEHDFICVSEELADEVVSVGGGIDDFPDAWDMSNHAPIIVKLND